MKNLKILEIILFITDSFISLIIFAINLFTIYVSFYFLSTIKTFQWTITNILTTFINLFQTFYWFIFLILLFLLFFIRNYLANKIDNINDEIFIKKVINRIYF